MVNTEIIISSVSNLIIKKHKLHVYYNEHKELNHDS